jgi:hypothetical protein
MRSKFQGRFVFTDLPLTLLGRPAEIKIFFNIIIKKEGEKMADKFLLICDFFDSSDFVFVIFWISVIFLIFVLPKIINYVRR